MVHNFFFISNESFPNIEHILNSFFNDKKKVKRVSTPGDIAQQ